jgi:hypothetical protein
MTVKCRGCGEPLPRAEDPYNELKHENNCLASKLSSSEKEAEDEYARLECELETKVDEIAKLPSWRNAAEPPNDMKTVMLWRTAMPDSAENIYDGMFAGLGFGWYSPSYGWYAGDHGADEARKKGKIAVTHWMPLPEAPKP